MFKGYIYHTLDQKHNKVYIGKKFGLPENSKDYFGSGNIINKIIRNRGIFLLKKTILGVLTAKTKLELRKILNEAEITCIYHFCTFGADGIHKDEIYGYNLTIGGDGNGGMPFSEEHKERLRKPKSLEARKNMNKDKKGKKKSKESIKKQLETKRKLGLLGKGTGKPRSKEVIEKVVQARKKNNKGYKPEHSVKIWASRRKNGNDKWTEQQKATFKNTINTRENFVSKNLGRKRSEKEKQQISETCRNISGFGEWMKGRKRSKDSIIKGLETKKKNGTNVCSKEKKEKIGKKNKGKTPWNKGKKRVYSEETLTKMRLARKRTEFFKVVYYSFL
jgi:hypothetical protein